MLSRVVPLSRARIAGRGFESHVMKFDVSSWTIPVDSGKVVNVTINDFLTVRIIKTKFLFLRVSQY